MNAYGHKPSSVYKHVQNNADTLTHKFLGAAFRLPELIVAVPVKAYKLYFVFSFFFNQSFLTAAQKIGEKTPSLF